MAKNGKAPHELYFVFAIAALSSYGIFISARLRMKAKRIDYAKDLRSQVFRGLDGY